VVTSRLPAASRGFVIASEVFSNRALWKPSSPLTRAQARAPVSWFAAERNAGRTGTTRTNAPALHEAAPRCLARLARRRGSPREFRDDRCARVPSRWRNRRCAAQYRRRCGWNRSLRAMLLSGTRRLGEQRKCSTREWNHPGNQAAASSTRTPHRASAPHHWSIMPPSLCPDDSDSPRSIALSGANEADGRFGIVAKSASRGGGRRTPSERATTR